jgi:hypothetical protein
MGEIPNEISLTESLTHSLNIPMDVKPSTKWVRERALLPPPKSNGEVSFNRACYISDSAQKALAKNIKRSKGEQRAFLRINRQNLHTVLAILIETKEIRGDQKQDVEFVYTPIYDFANLNTTWPENIPRIEGNGYNPAHADLKYINFQKGEPDALSLAVSIKLADDQNEYCNVIIEAKDHYGSDEWMGESLCASK